MLYLNAVYVLVYSSIACYLTMSRATYATVLPDGISSTDAAAAYRDQLYAQRAEASRDPEHSPNANQGPTQRAPSAAAPPPQKKPSSSDNKPLIIGLLIVIAILVLIVSIQIIKKREKDAVDAAEAARLAAQSQAPGPGPGQQPAGPQPSTGGRAAEGIADRVASHITQKGRAIQQRIQPAISSTLGRQTTNDSRHLATIIENAEENSEVEDVRPMIAAALAKDAREEPICSGSEIVQTADQAARAEIEAETGPSPSECKMAADEDDSEDAPVCTAILQTGQRAGQVCCRKVKPGADFCSSHTKRDGR